MQADRIISELAVTQHGVVSRSQLLTAGLSRHVVQGRLDRGLLAAVHGGVYRAAGSPATWSQRIMAGVLAAGPDAVASHRSAGFLHGLSGVEPRVEVIVGRSRAPRPPGLVIHRVDTLAASDVEVRDGIPRTRAAPTLLALAAVLPARLVETALDDALVRGLVSGEQLRRRLDGVGRQGRSGAAALGELLAQREGRRWTQSEFERRLLRLVVAVGLPPPIPQYEVRLADGRRAFLDFAWPELRLGLEAESYRHHAGRLAWGRDHTRNALLVAEGWRVLPVTWDDLTERPDDLVALLRRARAA